MKEEHRKYTHHALSLLVMVREIAIGTQQMRTKSEKIKHTRLYFYGTVNKHKRIAPETTQKLHATRGHPCFCFLVSFTSAT